MPNIRGKIYYDMLTGNILARTAEQSNAVGVIETTIEQDFESLAVLNERVRDTVGVIILEIGQYEQDFAEGILHSVDLATGKPKFVYPDLENPKIEPQPVAPLSDDIQMLKEIIATQDLVLEEVMFNIIPLISGGGN